jgi:L-Ala-D/L-Glu epimerase
MNIESINATQLSIPFVQAFKHAAAERSATQTLWVEVRTHDGLLSCGEGCPREYVTAEGLDTARAFVAAHRLEWQAQIHDVVGLRAWVNSHRADIDTNPAAWTAVELALLDALGREQDCSVEKLLGLPDLDGKFYYTAVVGDAATEVFRGQVARYRKVGFTRFKIKLAGNLEHDSEKVKALIAAGIDSGAVRADANNLWNDARLASDYLHALDYPFMAIEEPLRAGDHADLKKLALMMTDASLSTRIILDESLLRETQLQHFQDQPERWIVNLRISKMGGVLRSLQLVEAIRAAGLGLIIGAHVGETSVLTRAALIVAQRARDILIAQEGAFGTHLLSRDVVAEPLMFGAGGMLDSNATGIAGKSGLGLAIL